MGHKQRTLSLEGVTLKETNLSFGSVSTSVIPQDSDEAEKEFLLCSGEKKMGPNQLFLVWCLIMVEMSFSLNTNNFFLVSEKNRSQILLIGISDGTNMVIYHVLIIEKSERKFFN